MILESTGLIRLDLRGKPEEAVRHMVAEITLAPAGASVELVVNRDVPIPFTALELVRTDPRPVHVRVVADRASTVLAWVGELRGVNRWV